MPLQQDVATSVLDLHECMAKMEGMKGMHSLW